MRLTVCCLPYLCTLWCAPQPSENMDRNHLYYWFHVCSRTCWCVCLLSFVILPTGIMFPASIKRPLLYGRGAMRLVLYGTRALCVRCVALLSLAQEGQMATVWVDVCHCYCLPCWLCLSSFLAMLMGCTVICATRAVTYTESNNLPLVHLS